MRLLLCFVLGLSMWGEARADTRRIAVVVGNNAGTGEMPPLRYAEADAGKMARVLAELGQVSPDDLLLLQGRSLADLERALALAQARVAELHRSPDARAVLLFYFSGHSDGEALEIGKEKLPFSRLRALLTQTGAEVKVGIIDSCRSGAAVLLKGGKPAPPFSIRLSDELNAKGEAMLTSSAADEVALESKEVMGSYFTHHLVSGLRGAADLSGDHQVTLAEAYHYAYDHTVSATAMTMQGAQHPVYDYRLSGQGELVLSSLVRPSAAIELPEGFDRALVTDLARDQIAAELASGAAREVALAPGLYGVRAFRGGKAFGGRFQLEPGAVRSVAWAELQPTEVAVVGRKGADVSREVQITADRGLFSVSLGGALGVSQVPQGALRLAYQVGPLGGLGFALVGATGQGLTGSLRENAVQARVGYSAGLELGGFALQGGAELGPGAIWQMAESKSSGSTLTLAVGPQASARMRLGGAWSLSLELEGMATLLKVSDGPSSSHVAVILLPAATLGLAFGL